MKPRAPLTICYPFTGDIVGGSHFSTLGLIESLDRDRFRPLIVPQRSDGAIASFFREHGLEVEPGLAGAELAYDTRVGLWQYLRTLADLPAQIALIHRLSVDIVHTNDGRTHATWALAARLAGARLLWHHRGDPKAAGLRLIAPLLANRVVAVSQFARPAEGLWSAGSRTEVVHSPFDTAIEEDRVAARADLVAELGCSAQTWLVGYMGAFVARKRPFLFIDAVVELVCQHPARPIAALMFGEDYDGKTERALVTYARRRGVSHVVRFMGFRRNGPHWLAGCDLLMVPAFGEPFGRTLIEAMLVGTPIVATASGGNVEALRDGTLGTLVPPDNAVALANACHRLRSTPQQAASVAQRAAADARSRFGIERHASRIMAIYTEMLDETRSRPVSDSSRATT